MSGRKRTAALLLSLLLLGRPLIAEEITNPFKTDGFGSQFQTIIYAIVYAELKEKTFLYTPFSSLEHNYDGDPDFLRKKEWLVNLIDYFPINRDPELQHKISVDKYIRFFEGNLEECANSKALKKIKKLFRKNKRRENYFDGRFFNIAIHIRRPNPHDCRVYGTDTPDAIFENIIETLRDKYSSQNCLFHIYSQGDEAHFRRVFEGDDIVFHLNESIENTFASLVFADVLVTSPSAFSHTAALLSNGIVYYMPFYHRPLPYWLEIDF